MADPIPWQNFRIEHLQLPVRITNALVEAGISTLGTACAIAESNDAGRAPYAPELVEAVNDLRRAGLNGTIDWSSYWSNRDNRFYHLAAAHPALDRLARIAGEAEVTRGSLGNAGAMLQASGIATLSDLIDRLRSGLAPVHGLGQKKLDELFARLTELTVESSSGEWPESLDRIEAAGLPVLEISLCVEARALPMSVLQLGTKAGWLQKAGFGTVGDLADADPTLLLRLRSIGRTTLDIIRTRIRALADAGTEDGVDWHVFARITGVPLLPLGPVSSGAAMLAVLPQVLDELGGYLSDDSYRDILANRLSRTPREQSTLEEIGQRSIPPVTRERIRQKEAKLLSQLAGSLVWDHDGKLKVQFHPEFSGWWKRAAAEFEGIDEIGFDEFVERLAQVWDVPLEELTPYLPFIVAIVTGEPRMPASFRAGVQLDSRLRRLSPYAAETPLLRFRLGKAGRRLIERGVGNLAAFVQLASQGGLNTALESGLGSIARSLRNDGTIDWNTYAAQIPLPVLPAQSPAGPAEFAGSFAAAVGEVLGHLYSSGRPAQIFELRTRHPAGARRTLAVVADIMKTHGPTVKREETELLEDLHDILVEREFTELPIWLDQNWLDYCREAHAAYQASLSDYERFAAGLALRWNVRPQELQDAVPGLWAIFTGYPEGRYRRAPVTGVLELVPVEPVTRIQLRGFRRLH